jgi:DNA-formamidopyrimidine glycosylase
MPELPEVEALASFLRGRAVGLAIARVDVGAIHVLKTYDPPPTALAGAPVTGVTRRGKFLDLDADGLHLVVHLARAGWLRWSEQLSATPLKPSGRGPIALRVHLEDGAGFDLTEAGTKKGLAVHLVTDPAGVPGIARLGIDPLDPAFTPEALAALLAERKGARLKTVLTDQSVLAGVGNAYSDEVLWVARMSPFTPCSSMSPEKVTLLYDALVGTLRDAVAKAEGLAAQSLKAEKKAGLAVHGRTGLPCPRCGDTVREISFADKSWQYCPTCQTGGEPLADRRLSRLLR